MMLRSFLLQSGSSKEDLTEASLHLFPYSDESASWRSGNVRMYTNGHPALQPEETTSSVLFVVNDEPNEDPLDKVYDLKFNTQTRQERITQGVRIIITDESIHIYNGPSAATPVYYCRNEQDILVSTEIKALIHQDLVDVGRPVTAYFQTEPFFKPKGSTPVSGISKLHSDTVLEIDRSSGKIHLNDLPASISVMSFDLQDCIDDLYKKLDHWVAKRIANRAIGIPLSGGCDSGAVAGIASKYQQGFHTFTMGTEQHNEFKEARSMSAHIGSMHHEITINNEELIPAILKGIFLNEISDAEYAIGYAGLYFTYKAASGLVELMLTGYGADLTLSNFLKVQPDSIGQTTANLLYRTGQTGELSPFVPSYFNLEVAHPFLDPEIIDLIVAMPLSFKEYVGPNGIVDKHIEKEMIRKYDLMPKELIHRPKKALHTGAGIMDLFHQITFSKGKDFRSGFLHGAWKQLIFEGVRPEACDRERILNDAKEFK